MAKILLIDGYSIINRAYYGVPLLTNSYGEYTNGIYGFLNIMFKIIDEEQPQYLAVAFDVKAPTFRHKMFTEYKGTRKPMPTELTSQVPLLKELLGAMEIPCVQKEGLEADDIIGTLSRTCEGLGMEVVILSGDRDLLQLATKKTLVRIPKTSKGKTEVFNYYEDDVLREYGVTPTEFIDMKALMGDTSDNIPGLPGVGEKTAGALISTYHSIENCQAHVDEIKPNKARLAFLEHYDLAKLSKVLATIKVDAQIDFTVEDAKIKDIFTPQAYEIIKRHNFKSYFQRFTDKTTKKNVELPKTTVVEDYNEALLVFEKARKMKTVGVSLALEPLKNRADFTLQGVGLSFSKNDEQTPDNYFIPVINFIDDTFLEENLRLLAKETQISIFAIKPLLHVLGHGFDLQKETDKFIQRMDDVSILAYLINPLKSEYTYEELANQYLNITLPSMAEVFEKKTFYEMMMTNEEGLFTYYGNNAYCCVKLVKELKKQVTDMGMLSLYENLERPLVYSLFSMEQLGIVLDAKELKKYADKLSCYIAETEEEIYAQAGDASRKINLNSPKQLGEFLFETLSLPGGKKTKSGYSTSADVLEKLAPEYPIVKKILEYRQLTKLKSTYADGLGAYICEDGRIHGTFHQTITATGRISSAEPNLQNIPTRTSLGREIRKLFVPKDGCVFIDADYSQIELRILADMSEDERLIGAYASAQDIHAVTASEVFHVPLSEVTPTLRRNAKAVNFGIVYGISAFGLSEDLSISKKEAAQYIEQYFQTYPGIKSFLDKLVADAKATGYSVTKYGRRRPVPELSASNFMQRSFGERVAMNAPIQGTAADIMKIAMIHVDRELRQNDLSSRILVQVHDELLLEVPKEEVDTVKELLVSCMKKAADLKVSLEVSAAIGSNWYETK